MLWRWDGSHDDYDIDDNDVLLHEDNINDNDDDAVFIVDDDNTSHENFDVVNHDDGEAADCGIGFTIQMSMMTSFMMTDDNTVNQDDKYDENGDNWWLLP